MNTKNTARKGFTTVELVIVIAVIAILATVLIPTFSGLIAKANLSADKQNVRNMNICLTTEIASQIKANKPEDFGAVKELLKEYGYGEDSNFVPKSKGFSFRWFIDDKGDNDKSNDMSMIVLVDDNDVVVFPEEYAGLSDITNVRKYFDLSLPAAEIVKDDDPEVTVNVDGVDRPLAVMYTFTANQEISTNYNDWQANFYAWVDKDVQNVALAGSYDSWQHGAWIAMPFSYAPANHEKGLLGAGLPYSDVQSVVGEFRCGVLALDDAAVVQEGTVLTVELRLTNPDDATDQVVLGIFKYEFE